MVEFVGDEELLQVMENELPPDDYEQACAYFTIAFERLARTRPAGWRSDAHLLAGVAPDLLWRHWLREHEVERLKRADAALNGARA